MDVVVAAAASVVIAAALCSRFYFSDPLEKTVGLGPIIPAGTSLLLFIFIFNNLASTHIPSDLLLLLRPSPPLRPPPAPFPPPPPDYRQYVLLDGSEGFGPLFGDDFAGIKDGTFGSRAGSSDRRLQSLGRYGQG